MILRRGRVLFAVACLALAFAASAPAETTPVPFANGRVIDTTFVAPTLGGARREALVYLPPSYAASGLSAAARWRYPVVYLLHGGPGWPGDWFQHGDLARTFDALIHARRIPEVIAIAPDGRGCGRKGMSLWADSYDGRSRMQSYFVHDVIAWADRAFRTVPLASARALVGISDGADAALRMTFAYPREFAACAGLSGRYHAHGPDGLERVLGPHPQCERRAWAISPLALVAAAAPRLRGHTIYYDAGVFDAAAWDVAAMDASLTALAVPYESHLYAGYHDWPFWKQRLRVALPVVCAHFAVQRS